MGRAQRYPSFIVCSGDVGYREGLNPTYELLQQLSELLDTKSCLSDDGAKSARLQIASRVHRHRYGTRRITGIHKDMVTADDSINHKSGSLEGANDRGAARYRQSPARHS